MLKVKGPLFKSTLKAIRKHLGTDTYESFLAELPEDIRSFVSGSILSSSFYPADNLIKITEAYVKFSDQDPHAAYFELGRISASEGFSGVYKVFLKIGTPKLMVRQSPLLWKSYYNQGLFEVPETGDNSATLRITGASIEHVCLCSRISGFIERTMELSGGKNVRFNHTKCQIRGDDCEEWDVSWE